MQPANNLGLAMHERIRRNIETERLETRANLQEVFDQKTLGAADVEHAHPGFEAEMSDDVAGHWNPPAVIAIPAISIVPRPVEIHLAVLLRDCDDCGILRILALLDVALRPR